MLTVKNLRCERSRRILFEGLSFSAAAGEVVQLEGANGAGKSTLLKILMGLFEDFEGDVEWQIDDYPLYLAHRAGVNDHLTVRENIEFLAKLQEQQFSAEQISAMLAKVGLQQYANVECGSLSEGQRKRVNLARLYGFSNRVWVLDEPFSALDQAGIESLRQRMVNHIEADGLVVLTSHQVIPIDGLRTIKLEGVA